MPGASSPPMVHHAYLMLGLDLHVVVLVAIFVVGVVGVKFIELIITVFNSNRTQRLAQILGDLLAGLPLDFDRLRYFDRLHVERGGELGGERVEIVSAYRVDPGPWLINQ